VNEDQFFIMNIFIQGMRRSGTTILFDLLCEDGNFDCYYEPLAAANKPAIGGGSGLRSIDYFDKIKSSRIAFASQYAIECIDRLNYGAPYNAELEFDTDLPEYCREYIKFITNQSEHTVIKFTRMYCKIPVLWEIDPTAKFIHAVRHPCSVTTSYLFGKNKKNKHKFTTTEAFFGRESKRLPWSSHHFSEYILNQPEYSHLITCKDFMRVLIVWKYNFIKTHELGQYIFKDNYYLFRHEDLLANTQETIEALYQFLERPLPDNVLNWAKKVVDKSKSRYYEPGHLNWLKAIQILDLNPQLYTTKYSL